MEDGRVVVPSARRDLGNVLSGRSRGVEVLVQRRSANGLSGWVAYSYGTARRHDEETGPRLRLRLRPAPHRDRLRQRAPEPDAERSASSTATAADSPCPASSPAPSPGICFLSDERNRLRPAGYGRLDLRANKAWLFRGWKLTLFAEVLNVLDRENVRYNGQDGIDFRTGRVFLSSDTLFPHAAVAGESPSTSDVPPLSAQTAEEPARMAKKAKNA